MGLFDIFKRGKQPTEPAGALPTVSAPTNLPDCYAAAFKAEMHTIGVLTEAETRQALTLILEGEGGCLNLGRYHPVVFNRFFQGRTWTWTWHQEWGTRFDALGGRPTTWPVFHPYKAPALDVEVPRLTVAKLKEWLSEAGIAFPEAAKGAALRELALSSEANRHALEKTQSWTDKVEDSVKQQGFAQYTMVMRTILFRAKAQSDRARAATLGVTKWELLVVHKVDQRFIDFALSVTPNAVGPLYPGDMTLLKAVLPGFDTDEDK